MPIQRTCKNSESTNIGAELLVGILVGLSAFTECYGVLPAPPKPLILFICGNWYISVANSKIELPVLISPINIDTLLECDNVCIHPPCFFLIDFCIVAVASSGLILGSGPRVVLRARAFSSSTAGIKWSRPTLSVVIRPSMIICLTRPTVTPSAVAASFVV